MSTLPLPSKRPGWSAHPERQSTNEALAFEDVRRWLHAVIDRLIPRHRPRLPRKVARALLETQTSLATADSKMFQEAVAKLRAELQSTSCNEVTTGRALGIVGLAMARTVGKTPYDTQYLAAWLILQGHLVELATGEGKTLAAAMAAAVAGLSQVPVHLLTSNDYLVERDRQAFAPFYDALGLRVGFVLASMAREVRLPAYDSDITFVTPKELTFDYLKDHLVQNGNHDPRVLRARALQQHGTSASASSTPGAGDQQTGPVLAGLYMAIIDEADACLLDEAMTPLILAQSDRPVNIKAYSCAFTIAAKLKHGRDYQLLPIQRLARLTQLGRSLVDLRVYEACAQQQGLATALAPPQRAHELVESALAATCLITRGREYAVTTEGIQLIDEVTGRIADGRQWSTSLQQMIELKEGLVVKPMTAVTAQITFQRFFPRYQHLGGMSGSLIEARHELRLLYGLGVTPVPLARASRMQWLGESLFIDAASKWAAVVEATATHHGTGRPVLVGTDSIADSTHLSGLLSQAGIPHQVLNAIQDAHEAAYISQAGRRNAVTVTTNMAGRGTDIRLDLDAKAVGGLHVIACMRNRARRIDRQLIGRTARHGDPGSAQRMVALDDLLLQRQLPGWLRWGAEAITTALRLSQVPTALAHLLLFIGQRRAEWQESNCRKQLRHTERHLNDQYGFTGSTE